MATLWIAHDPRADDYLGLIPHIISENFSSNVKEQIAEGYAHGGGYSPFGQGKWHFDPKTKVLTYPVEEPGDEPEVWEPKASAAIRDELVVVYASGIVAIVQPDGTFAVTRMD